MVGQIVQTWRLTFYSKDICSKRHFGCSKIVEQLGTWAVFTTLHFLQNLQMGPISKALHYTRLERLTRDEHSSLLDPFESYEEIEVLLIGPVAF
jgi:hypothetical protein